MIDFEEYAEVEELAIFGMRECMFALFPEGTVTTAEACEVAEGAFKALHGYLWDSIVKGGSKQ